MVKVFFAIFLLGMEFGLDLGKILSNVFRVRLEPMTWEKLRPKILARKFSVDVLARPHGTRLKGL